MSDNRFKICVVYGKSYNLDKKIKKVIRLALIDLVVDYHVHDFIFLENNDFQRLIYQELQVLKDELDLYVERFSYKKGYIDKSFYLEGCDFVLCCTNSLSEKEIVTLNKYKNIRLINLDNYI